MAECVLLDHACGLSTHARTRRRESAPEPKGVGSSMMLPSAACAPTRSISPARTPIGKSRAMASLSACQWQTICRLLEESAQLLQLLFREGFLQRVPSPHVRFLLYSALELSSGSDTAATPVSRRRSRARPSSRDILA